MSVRSDLHSCQALHEEICKYSKTLHPQVSQLVEAFFGFLRQPQFSTPITISNLSKLFKEFYDDLNTLVIMIYTHSTSNKKKLIAKSEYFASHPDEFDYLLAIANFSAPASKFPKRSDEAALYQLRVFHYYKFLAIYETIEEATRRLFLSTGPDDEIVLLEKVLKFEERDIIIQEFLNEKLEALRAMNLLISSFVETDPSDKLNNFFGNSSDENSMLLRKIKSLFLLLNEEVTPLSKLKTIVEIQKTTILLVAEIYEVDPSNINNDDLIPSLIFLIIKFVPLLSCDIYLNFIFIKNFINMIYPYNIVLTEVNSHTNFTTYNPDRHLTYRRPKGRKVLFDLINLKDNTFSAEENGKNKNGIFNNDHTVVEYIQERHLNTGDLNFYLVNFEAVLYFLQSITIGDLIPENDTENELLNQPLSKAVDDELMSHFKFPNGEMAEEGKAEEKSPGNKDNRSRSGSLLNTIGTKITDVASSMNRSRSNSSIKSHVKTSSTSIPTDNSVSKNSVVVNPSESNTDEAGSNSTGTMMKNILGKFGLSLALPNKPIQEEATLAVTDHPGEKLSPMTKTKSQGAKTGNSRLESTSTDNTNTSISNPGRNTITTRISSGVNDIVAKINSSNGNTGTLNTIHSKNASNLSLQSTTDLQADNITTEGTMDNQGEKGAGSSSQRRPEHARYRTPSLQIMDKWFQNISNGMNNSSSKNTSVQSTVATTEFDDEELKSVFKYRTTDFEMLTINDLRTLKMNYDRLCDEVVTRLQKPIHHGGTPASGEQCEQGEQGDAVSASENSI